MSQTGEHQAVPEVLEERTRKTLADVRWLMVLAVGSVVALFGGGWKAFAQVREEAKDAAVEQTAGLATEQKALKANVDDLRSEVSDLKSEVRELRKDLRVIFPKLPAPDGGR